MEQPIPIPGNAPFAEVPFAPRDGENSTAVFLYHRTCIWDLRAHDSRTVLTTVPLPIALPMVPAATVLALALASRTEIHGPLRLARRT